MLYLIATSIVVLVLIMYFALFKGISKEKSVIIRDINDVFKDILGDVPKYSWGAPGITGIAISNNLKQVALINQSIQKVYGVEQIRGHEIKNVEPGRVSPGITVHRDSIIGDLRGVGEGIGAAIAEPIANAALKREAQNKSGLFVQVKDIDHPVWRITMYNTHDQDRWHEILSQLYEGILS